jgi:hypothetical protein
MDEREAERRAHPRLSVSAAARVNAAGRHANYLVRNISAGGALLSGRATLPSATNVNVCFFFLRSLAELELSGRVLRCETEVEGFALVAIAFHDITTKVAAIVDSPAERAPTSGAVVLADSRVPHLRVLAQQICQASATSVLLARTPLEVVRCIHANSAVSAVFASRVGDELWAVQVLSIVCDDFPTVRRVLVCPRDQCEGASSLMLSGTVQAVLPESFTAAELARALGDP